MLKRLSMLVVLALAGILSACTNPGSPGTSPGSPPAVESPGESPGESPAESPSPEES
jgi:hypothetical protein